jgi:hypothetical protein
MAKKTAAKVAIKGWNDPKVWSNARPQTGEKTTTWIGAVSGGWSDRGNWTNGDPVTGDTAIVTDGAHPLDTSTGIPTVILACWDSRQCVNTPIRKGDLANLKIVAGGSLYFGNAKANVSMEWDGDASQATTNVIIGAAGGKSGVVIQVGCNSGGESNGAKIGSNAVFSNGAIDVGLSTGHNARYETGADCSPITIAEGYAITADATFNSNRNSAGAVTFNGNGTRDGINGLKNSVTVNTRRTVTVESTRPAGAVKSGR